MSQQRKLVDGLPVCEKVVPPPGNDEVLDDLIEDLKYRYRGHHAAFMKMLIGSDCWGITVDHKVVYSSYVTPMIGAGNSDRPHWDGSIRENIWAYAEERLARHNVIEVYMYGKESWKAVFWRDPLQRYGKQHKIRFFF
jgi:hypothetical protein